MQRVVPVGSLDQRRVHIPGMLVDMLVIAGKEHAPVTYAPVDQEPLEVHLRRSCHGGKWRECILIYNMRLVDNIVI